MIVCQLITRASGRNDVYGSLEDMRQVYKHVLSSSTGYSRAKAIAPLIFRLAENERVTQARSTEPSTIER
jgi:hypothetical protein